MEVAVGQEVFVLWSYLISNQSPISTYITVQSCDETVEKAHYFSSLPPYSSRSLWGYGGESNEVFPL